MRTINHNLHVVNAYSRTPTRKGGSSTKRPSARSQTNRLAIDWSLLVQRSHRETQWLFNDIWPAQGTGALVGKPKSFKTFFSEDMALAVASGGKFLGRAANKSGPVVILASEDSETRLRVRFEQLARWRRVKLPELPLHFIVGEPLAFDDEDSIERLSSELATIAPVLCIVDVFRDFYSGDENASHVVHRAWKPMIAMARRLDLKQANPAAPGGGALA